jgi:serine protease Do
MQRNTGAAIRLGLFLFILLVSGIQARAQYSRKTPVVEAVQKTRAGIVTLKVHRPGGRKDVLGAGVIVDERGYIVTNRHVIVAAESINVRLSDGTDLVGKLAAEIDTHDLAVVRIQTDKKLQALPLGPAGDLMVGETVIAIGNPYGYANSVSTGIISALDREVTMPAGETISNLIQTDASINPGNSGGPLLNINGQVVGITVALRDGAQGIAFALNADTVQQLLSKHLSAAKISGVQHGLTLKGKTSADSGDRPRVVVAESSAEFQSGDEIVRIGDRRICNRFDLERAFWHCKPSDSVSVTIQRDGKEHRLSLRLSQSENDPAFSLQPSRPQERASETQPASR